MTCAVCGAENDAGARFCFRCGSELGSPNAATGPTVNLERGATPPFGTPAAEADDDTASARVYDVPASPQPTAYQVPSPQSPYGPLNQSQGGAAPYYGPSGGTIAAAPPHNSAQLAMILGIVSVVLSLILMVCFFPAMIIAAAPAVPAIFIGRKARREIRDSGGRLSGDGMALAGLIMGAVSLGLVLLSVCAIAGLLAFVGSLEGFS